MDKDAATKVVVITRPNEGIFLYETLKQNYKYHSLTLDLIYHFMTNDQLIRINKLEHYRYVDVGRMELITPPTGRLQLEQFIEKYKTVALINIEIYENNNWINMKRYVQENEPFIEEE
jgi:hypothetical protein